MREKPRIQFVKYSSVFTALILTLVVLSEMLVASMTPQSVYTVELMNGARVFHMEPAQNTRKDVISQPVDFNVSGPYPVSYTKTSYSAQPQPAMASGLYDVTDGMKCIYTLDPYLYIYEGNLYLSEDGSRFFSVHTAGSLALSYYVDGKMSKSYKVSEIMANTGKRTFTSEGTFWESYAERSFDAGTGTLYLTALDGVATSYDVDTGDIVERSYPKGMMLPVTADKRRYGLLIIVPVTALVVLWNTRRRRGN